MYYFVVFRTFIKPTRFQSEIGPHFGIDLYFEDIYSITILILRYLGFPEEAHVHAFPSVLVQSNLIYIFVHVMQYS